MRQQYLTNQPTAGKTGTTQNVTDKWFCGYTPYLTCAIWLGYDDNSKELPNYINHRLMWHNIMQDIHNDYETGSFEKPDDIVEMTVCKQSGLLMTDLCSQDPRGDQAVTEYFAADNVPTKECDRHVKVTMCLDSDKVAGPGCTNTATGVLIRKETPSKAVTEGDEHYTTWDAAYSITDQELTEVCTEHANGGGSTKTLPHRPQKRKLRLLNRPQKPLQLQRQPRLPRRATDLIFR